MHRQMKLQKNADFQKVYKRGRSTANRQFVLFYFPHSASDQFRLGVSVSKKVGHAVVRNKVKRRLKEVFLQLKKNIHTGYDFVVIVRNPAVDLTFQEMRTSVIHLLKRAKLYRP